MRDLKFLILFTMLLFAASCQPAGSDNRTVAPASLRDVPALKLNFRFESDVPPPPIPAASAEERNAAIQADFDQNRAPEVLEKTITSPDKKRILAVYRKIEDQTAEFR